MSFLLILVQLVFGYELCTEESHVTLTGQLGLGNVYSIGAKSVIKLTVDVGSGPIINSSSSKSELKWRVASERGSASRVAEGIKALEVHQITGKSDFRFDLKSPGSTPLDKFFLGLAKKEHDIVFDDHMMILDGNTKGGGVAVWLGVLKYGRQMKMGDSWEWSMGRLDNIGTIQFVYLVKCIEINDRDVVFSIVLQKATLDLPELKSKIDKIVSAGKIIYDRRGGIIKSINVSNSYTASTKVGGTGDPMKITISDQIDIDIVIDKKK